MATLTDRNPAVQPPTFVRLTRPGETQDILLGRGHSAAHDLHGRWFCDIHGADGVRGTREIELPLGGADATLREVIADFRAAAPPKGKRERKLDWPISLDTQSFAVSLWSGPDDLTDITEFLPAPLANDDGSPVIINVDRHHEGRLYIRLHSEAGSTIASLFPGESYAFEAVSTSSGPLPAMRHVPRWDLAEAYWSFLLDGRDEAAEATGSALLRWLGEPRGSDTYDHLLLAATHATIRFPWLRTDEGRLDEILAARTGELLDLEVMDWARAFDRDPAGDDVFDARLLHLLERLRKEPPAYAMTVQILMERLRTAVVERERVRDMPDEAAWEVVRTVRNFAKAALRGHDRLVFEGEAPLRPTPRAMQVRAQKKTLPTTEESTTYGP